MFFEKNNLVVTGYNQRTGNKEKNKMNSVVVVKC